MTLQRTALWAIVIAASMYLLVAGRGLLLPLVLGLALWYMIDALADAFEQPRIGRVRLPRPIALLAFDLAIAKRRPLWYLLAAVSMSLVVLSNWLGAMALAIGVQRRPFVLQRCQR